jgi:hypothetical protein
MVVSNMEIKDRFRDGLVFQEGGVISTTPKEYKEGVSCLLCGEFIEFGHGVMVCKDCRKIWKQVKENNK